MLIRVILLDLFPYPQSISYVPQLGFNKYVESMNRSCSKGIEIF